MVLQLLATSASAQERDDEAHALYSAGAAAFAGGNYEDALGYWQRSYELSHRPELLFNIGQAADRSRQDALALRSFEQYLEALPATPNRTEIEGRIRVLQRTLAAHAPAPAPDPATTEPAPTAELPPPSDPAPTGEEATGPAPVAPPSESSSAGPDVAALALTVTGGVLVVTGAILLGVGAVDFYPPREGLLFQPENDRYVNAQILVGAGAAGLGVGLITGVIGIVMLASGGGSSASSTAALTPNGFVLRF